jgi:hypothetical protein
MTHTFAISNVAPTGLTVACVIFQYKMAELGLPQSYMEIIPVGIT